MERLPWRSHRCTPITSTSARGVARTSARRIGHLARGREPLRKLFVQDFFCFRALLWTLADCKWRTAAAGLKPLPSQLSLFLFPKSGLSRLNPDAHRLLNPVIQVIRWVFTTQERKKRTEKKVFVLHACIVMRCRWTTSGVFSLTRAIMLSLFSKHNTCIVRLQSSCD